MSEENVETVRAAFDAWNAGDMDAWEDFLPPDVIWRPPLGWPEPGPFIGREATLGQVQRLRGAWDANTIDPISDFLDADDRVVVRFVWSGRGHGPQLPQSMIGGDVRLHRSQAQDQRFRILLGPRRGPRSRRALGVADVGEKVEIVRGRSRDLQRPRTVLKEPTRRVSTALGHSIYLPDEWEYP